MVKYFFFKMLPKYCKFYNFKLFLLMFSCKRNFVWKKHTVLKLNEILSLRASLPILYILIILSSNNFPWLDKVEHLGHNWIILYTSISRLVLRPVKGVIPVFRLGLVIGNLGLVQESSWLTKDNLHVYHLL